MNYWKEHMGLRAVLMLASFVLGVILLVCGWRLTGQMGGLVLMLAGVALLLATLYLYNARFAESKNKR